MNRELELNKLLQKRIELENIISSNINNSNEKLKEYISLFEPNVIQMIISYVSYTNIFSFRRCGDIFELTGNCQMRFVTCTSFSQYLLVRGLIADSMFNENGPPQSKFLKPLTEYENPLKENTIWYYIAKDDINNFLSTITIENTDIANTRVYINGRRFFVREFACFCRSIKIFKYLFINKVEIDRWMLHSAVAGGSEEILQLLESRDVSFNNMLRTALQAHQNEIAKWLYENYKDIFFVFSDCVVAFNTEMMGYFIQNCGIDINEKGVLEKTALHYVTENNDTVLIRYLISKKANKEIKDEHGKTPVDYAQSSEVKYLFALSP